MSIKATYYGANGWLLQFDKTRILIDPWLNGLLTFPPGDWLIKGELKHSIDTPKDIDFLLLTQGQPDHTHPPTLEKLCKATPVIASKSSSKIVSKMGFTNVNTLMPGEDFSHNNLKIKATSGAYVPNIENGYIIDHNSYSVYIEPHGFLDKNIKPRYIDLVITPVIDFALPIAGKFIKGKSVLPEILNLFKPSTVLASTTGGDITFSGLINNLIKVDGSNEDDSLFKDISTNFINPEPLKSYVFDKK
tara:strand:+ start:1171 stop:1911 length:741 start_codon:yes stop_codon:yes gene_type:complete